MRMDPRLVFFTENKLEVCKLNSLRLKSKVDPCAKCGKRAMENSVMCTKCGKWVHGRYAKMKRMTSTLAKGFVCELCIDTMEGIVEPREKILFFDQVDFMKSFCN